MPSAPRGMRGAAEVQLGRAMLLIAAAVVVGIVLLHRTASPPTLAVTRSTTTTTAKHSGTAAPGNPATTVALRNPQDIKVLVANGTDTHGAASQFSNRLHSSGYNTLASTNTTTPAATTSVFYAPGYDREAAVVASLLGLGPGAVVPLPQQAPVAQLHDAQILVVIGPDLAGQGGGPAPSASSSTAPATTSTTVHRATTTTAKPAASTTSSSKP